MYLTTGTSQNGGDATIHSGSVSLASVYETLTSGDASTASSGGVSIIELGDVILGSGDSTLSDAGSVSVRVGTSAVKGSKVSVEAGSVVEKMLIHSGHGNAMESRWTASNGDSGHLQLDAGYGNDGNSGSVRVESGVANSGGYKEGSRCRRQIPFLRYWWGIQRY